ncbi:hypothetical protein GCM10010503_37470 [Streptomyces lucensis JCM 4490]|uniref:Uncharacterized protein n=1 Tax=Streptomyces lucensis JCM 4490 TaxID=1306176 RepID=A0A918J8E9_9ACTN|nr:hypothetical protein [Streptomyces lucensis]GGW56760.1 hypothetical protein GCM10010503_37470 [Streptomyces lucensis JCM 4490]
MGIELELRVDQAGARGRGRRRETVVRASHEHGEMLALALEGVTRGRLAQIDPYRDTRFTDQDAQAALPEVAALVRECDSSSRKAALLDLAEMLEDCVATPGSRLWFIGD